MRQGDVMRPLVEVLNQWHEFYMLLGTASATLVGLLFVATTVGSGVFSSGRQAPLRIFLSASVIHFSGIVIVCLVVMAPGQSWVSFGAMIAACGLFGVAYYCLTWRESVRDGLSKAIDWEDRIWYGILPLIGYLFETGSGITLISRMSLGCVALALSMGMLLVVGIHNAWDITVWTMSRRRDVVTEATGESGTATGAPAVQTSTTETTSDR